MIPNILTDVVPRALLAGGLAWGAVNYVLIGPKLAERVAAADHMPACTANVAALAARAALPIRIRVEARAGQADKVAARLGGARMNGRRVELSCGSGGKLAALRRVAALGDLIEDVDVALPNLDDVYRHYSGGGARHKEES